MKVKWWFWILILMRNAIESMLLYRRKSAHTTSFFIFLKVSNILVKKVYVVEFSN